MAGTVTRMKIRTYSELKALTTFEERFEYLRLNGEVGKETFGFDRYINQLFYQRSKEWKKIRDHIILRDNGCDLGIDGYEIWGRPIVHHMNPVSVEDIETVSEYLLNPEYLILTSHSTHNAIHYGDEKLIATSPIERTKNDTCPWKNNRGG